MFDDFQNWNTLKKTLDDIENPPMFKERDIWWCSIGHNVGHEQNGKNKLFNRPVLIIKKFNYRLFWGVPLTSQIKESRHYHKFIFNNIEQCALLTQMRLWDAGRLSNRYGRLSENEFRHIKRDLIAYLE